MNIPHSTGPGRESGEFGGDRGGAASADKGSVPRFPSSTILGSAGEAEIEHDGHLYRLRRTSRGGLVLTK